MSEDKKRKEPLKWEKVEKIMKPLASETWPWPIPEKWIGTNGRLKYKISSDKPIIVEEIIPFKDIIYKRFGELKEKHGNYGAVNPAFFELKQELKSKGINPEDYGLRDEPQHFNKAYNDWRTKRNKENI